MSKRNCTKFTVKLMEKEEDAKLAALDLAE